MHLSAVSFTCSEHCGQVLCDALLLIIAAELFVAKQEEFQTAEKPPRTPDASKTFRPAFDMESAIAIILERPLFSPTRNLPDPTPGDFGALGELSQLLDVTASR